MLLLVEQETKTGLSLGSVFGWVYPIKPTGFFGVCARVSQPFFHCAHLDFFSSVQKYSKDKTI